MISPIVILVVSRGILEKPRPGKLLRAEITSRLTEEKEAEGGSEKEGEGENEGGGRKDGEDRSENEREAHTGMLESGQIQILINFILSAYNIQ